MLVRRKLAVPGGGVVPDEGVTLRNLFEVLVEWLANVSRERMGPDWRKYFPIVGTIFFFILVSNLMGLIPGLAGATSSANTTWAWAVIAWVVYTAVGIAKHKWNYLVKFMGPSFFEKEIFGRHVHFRLLMPIFLVLEIPLDFARILTLAVRLLANMFADHAVVARLDRAGSDRDPGDLHGARSGRLRSPGFRVLAAHHDLHRSRARGASLRGALVRGPSFPEGVIS